MAPLPSLRNERGGVVLEGIVAFPLFFLGASLCLILTYILLVQIWLMHLGHLALICKAQGHSTYFCGRQIQVTAKVVMKFGRFQKISFSGTPHVRSEIQMLWCLKDWEFPIQQTILWEDVLRKKVL